MGPRAAVILSKNGHPAHVFTDEDRRKAAAVTNQIRREMRELVELELLNRELERRVARIEAKRERKREQARRRREARRAQDDATRAPERVDDWLERGYGRGCGRSRLQAAADDPREGALEQRNDLAPAPLAVSLLVPCFEDVTTACVALTMRKALGRWCE
jgi:hypothetical protein